MPKIHDVEQGSGDWFALRIGIPTASNFHKIVTPTGKFSKQSRGYAFYLLAEKLLNQSLESLSNLEWIARGKELEPQAVKMYEFQYDVATRPVGFVTTDDGRMGATPDRLLIGRAAALEVKCPAPQTHVAYMIDGFGADYIPQAQGQLYVGELEFVDRYSFHPQMPPVLHRTPRDEPYIRTLAAALDEFCNMLAEMIEHARSLGHYGERERLTTELDRYAKETQDRDLYRAAARLYAPSMDRDYMP